MTGRAKAEYNSNSFGREDKVVKKQRIGTYLGTQQLKKCFAKVFFLLLLILFFKFRKLEEVCQQVKWADMDGHNAAYFRFSLLHWKSILIQSYRSIISSYLLGLHNQPLNWCQLLYLNWFQQAMPAYIGSLSLYTPLHPCQPLDPSREALLCSASSCLTVV